MVFDVRAMIAFSQMGAFNPAKCPSSKFGFSQDFDVD